MTKHRRRCSKAFDPNEIDLAFVESAARVLGDYLAGASCCAAHGVPAIHLLLQFAIAGQEMAAANGMSARDLQKALLDLRDRAPVIVIDRGSEFDVALASFGGKEAN